MPSIVNQILTQGDLRWLGIIADISTSKIDGERQVSKLVCYLSAERLDSFGSSFFIQVEASEKKCRPS